jgi:ribosomal protein L37E
MDRTISVKCPECGYVRYDLIHISLECGGLLLKRDRGDVICRLCGGDMSYEVEVTCPACGY